MRAVEGPIRLASEEGITKVWKDPKWIERAVEDLQRQPLRNEEYVPAWKVHLNTNW